MSVTASKENSCEDNLYFDVCAGSIFWSEQWVWGYTDCPTKYEGTQAHPNRTCTQSVIELNASRASGPPINTLACHELGHSVGLHHVADIDGSLFSGTSPGACMNRDGTFWGNPRLSNHDIAL